MSSACSCHANHAKSLHASHSVFNSVAGNQFNVDNRTCTTINVVHHNSPKISHGKPGAGQRKGKWYVIFRGSRIGVFCEQWSRIEPYVKHKSGKPYNGAWWKKVASQDEGWRCFVAAGQKGQTGIICTSNKAIF